MRKAVARRGPVREFLLDLAGQVALLAKTVADKRNWLSGVMIAGSVAVIAVAFRVSVRIHGSGVPCSNSSIGGAIMLIGLLAGGMLFMLTIGNAVSASDAKKHKRSATAPLLWSCLTLFLFVAVTAIMALTRSECH